MPIDLTRYGPTTLEKAIDILYKNLDEDEHKELFNPSSIAVAFMHNGIMMEVRNEWSLWDDGDLAKHFKSVYGLGHADDMSGMIQNGLIARIRGLPYDPFSEAIKYHEYWKNQGRDPLTLAPI